MEHVFAKHTTSLHFMSWWRPKLRIKRDRILDLHSLGKQNGCWLKFKVCECLVLQVVSHIFHFLHITIASPHLFSIRLMTTFCRISIIRRMKGWNVLFKTSHKEMPLDTWHCGKLVRGPTTPQLEYICKIRSLTWNTLGSCRHMTPGRASDISMRFLSPRVFNRNCACMCCVTPPPSHAEEATRHFPKASVEKTWQRRRDLEIGGSSGRTDCVFGSWSFHLREKK